MPKLEEMLINARMQILCDNPFLGYLLQNITMEEHHDIPTAATDGYKIMFNRVFMENLTQRDFIFIILHELLHIILSHPARGYQKDNHRFNVACDIVINDILDKFDYGCDQLTPIYGHIYDIDGLDNTAESIYEILPQEIKQPTLDFHTFWRTLSSSERDHLSHIIKTGIQSYPGSQIIQSLHGIIKETSHYNWKSVLAMFLTKNRQDYTYQRCDKRYTDILLPDYIADETLQNVWLIMDVSGSMYHVLDEVMSQVLDIVKQHRGLDVDLSFFSTIVTKPIRIKSTRDYQEAIHRIRTTGGTRFDIIFDAINTHYKGQKPYAIIILTDGYAQFPSHNPCVNIPILWGITNEKVIPPFGKVIRI